MDRLLAIDLRHLTKRYGNVTAVNDLSLAIRSGEIVAFLGPNGAGKTTTIDMILGLAKPDEGSVQVYGRAPVDAIARGDVSAVMQNGGLLKDFTVGETVRYTASLYANPQPVNEVLERAGIAAIADRRVGKCSGGEQQRLRFAMSLLSNPRLLLLDEPTAGMDVEARRDFWTAIREDASHGRTVMFATHYLEEADAYADRIVLVRQGSIVADGTTAAVKSMASGRMVRATIPNADRDALAALSGVTTVELRGDTVLITCTDSDAVARHLLTQTEASDLEIAANSLEAAFMALTGDAEVLA